MNLKDQKGINLLTLSIAILVLIIITSILVYNAKDGVKIRNLNNLYNDIEVLNDKVSNYYIQYGDIPKSVEYENTNFIGNQRNPNDGEDYYVINLSNLQGLSLNYGRDYEKIGGRTSVNQLTDIYIINEQSHTIYYPKGIELDSRTYYTTQEQYTQINLVQTPGGNENED